MIADPRVARAVLKGHQGIAKVVGLLNPLVPMAVDHKTPDVVEARSSDLEATAIELKAPDLALVEGRLLTVGGAHIG